MYTIRNGLIIRDDGTSISNDENHPDYQDYQKWLSQGNKAQTQELPTSTTAGNPITERWKNLAIAFHRSHLYSVRLREATAGAPADLCDQLWWLDKDLTTVVVNWIGDEQMREQKLKECFSALFDVLKEAGFPVSEEDKAEINKALTENGFEPLAN